MNTPVLNKKYVVEQLQTNPNLRVRLTGWDKAYLERTDYYECLGVIRKDTFKQLCGTVVELDYVDRNGGWVRGDEIYKFIK